MKKLFSLGTILTLLWAITKFWPAKKDTAGRVEVRVNARRAKTTRPKARTRKAARPRTRPRPQQQPRRTPVPEIPVEV